MYSYILIFVHTFKRMLPETRYKSVRYFEQGHSPSSAIELDRLSMEIEFPYHKDLEIDMSDRSLNPWTRDVYYLHRKWRESHLEKGNGEHMFLEKIIDNYNRVNNHIGGKVYL